MSVRRMTAVDEDVEPRHPLLVTIRVGIFTDWLIFSRRGRNILE